MKMKYRVKWRRILWGVNADRVPAEDQALIDWAHSLLPPPLTAEGPKVLGLVACDAPRATDG